MAIRHERATSAALVGVGVFQALLAAGAPWGIASWGGGHRGVLPGHLRTISGGAAVAYLGTAAFIISGKGSRRLRSRTFTAISLLMGSGTVVNALSRSRLERLVWTPVTALTAAIAWRPRS